MDILSLSVNSTQAMIFLWIRVFVEIINHKNPLISLNPGNYRNIRIHTVIIQYFYCLKLCNEGQKLGIRKFNPYSCS
jgi:hypothetical protein